MNALVFLIVFPLVIALLALLLPRSPFARIVGLGANMVLASVPLYLLFTTLSAAPAYYRLENHLIDDAMLIIEIVVAVYILYVSFTFKKYLAALLIAVQSAAIIGFEFLNSSSLRIEHSLFVDKFSIVMALIIGCIGSAICLYAIGYIREYHQHHPEVKNRPRFFFFFMYLFLSAMFGIVFSNNLLWLFFFWEITTFCSFMLIGYQNDDLSRQSAFRALEMNLFGGVVFAFGLIYLYYSTGTMELDRILWLGEGVVLIPAVCIAFAGLVKSAQFPFSSWLTAAMVAPTPVSALLHSSTMVKAGVYVILRVAPLLENTVPAQMITLVGGVSFLVTALIAISQSNAKKVLAYSTISNLGLIVACAGVNSRAALWSALLLIIFHAVAKSLLFLCVGIVESKLGSRDIEDMDYLVVRMPRLATSMMIGMAGMVVAPFGMVIAKVATLKAFVATNPGMAVVIAYGGAATVFFWTKWMGKIVSSTSGADIGSVEHQVSPWEQVVLVILAFATVAVILAFPFLAYHVIDPYVERIFGGVPTIDPFNMCIILVAMIGLWVIMPLGLFYYGFRDRKVKRVGTYLGGGNIDRVSFEGAMNSRQPVQMKNYYLQRYFNEEVLFAAGVVISITFLLIMFGVITV
ncbi:MAG TPA: proton-conducting transporter membrane subunit [Thermodesulfobacteriota bacterium]|nr:proton-conducting transporter membrane subunit [Thermodesulfobacteriota bacterium]